MMDLRVARRWQVVLVLVVFQFLCPSETATVNMLASNTKCSKCPPGFGMVQLCSPLNDTVCVECPPGFYSSHNSAFERCYPCSKCGPSLYEAQSCTTRTDTVCDRCATVMGPHNMDFFAKHCNDTIFVMEQPKPSSAWRNELFVQYQHLPVADHQKLTAPAAERALWPTLAAAIAVIFGVAALLVTIVQGVRSHFTRNIQKIDLSFDQEMTLLKEMRPPDDLDEVTCLSQQQMSLILHEEETHEPSEAIG
ncbi:tumor necrosis factor receptor superfamily member 11B-like [Cloeon dipterum]|uniref:tumor necrosis factor receptor superfamily member 11B-like n=1 Tax=Cloeon dipterum TaxID=197152 RepID=UPI00321F7C47